MLPTNSGKNIPAKKADSEQTAFESLQLLLQYLGFDTLLMPVNNDNPIEQLMISSGNDEDEKGFMLRLIFANDMAQATNQEQLKSEAGDTYYLQFLGMYPLQVKENKYLEMFLLMSVFNRLMTIGSFDYSDEGLFYRYCHANKGRELDNKLIVELLNMMTFFFEQFGAKLIQFAQNDQSLPDAITEFEQTMGQIVNPNSK